jgi:hypothetical protein
VNCGWVVFLPQETAYRTSSAVLRAAQTFFAKVALPFPVPIENQIVFTLSRRAGSHSCSLISVHLGFKRFGARE